MGTTSKEFKQKQKQIKENRRQGGISAGPQSHILEGVSWDEAQKLQVTVSRLKSQHIPYIKRIINRTLIQVELAITSLSLEQHRKALSNATSNITPWSTGDFEFSSLVFSRIGWLNFVLSA